MKNEESPLMDMSSFEFSVPCDEWDNADGHSATHMTEAFCPGGCGYREEGNLCTKIILAIQKNTENKVACFNCGERFLIKDMLLVVGKL